MTPVTGTSLIQGWALIFSTWAARFDSRSGKAWNGRSTRVPVASAIEFGHRAVLEGQHPAAGVLDDDDLLGAEETLADDQRADRVVGREAAGVADDVGLARPEAEDVLDGQPRVHAGEDGELAGRRELEVRPVERRRVASVLGEGALGLGRTGGDLGHWIGPLLA